MPPFNCRVDVFPKPGIANPEALTFKKNLPRINQDLEGFVSEFNVGRVFKFVLESPSAEKATSTVTLLANRLLTNRVLEEFSVTIEPLEPSSEQEA